LINLKKAHHLKQKNDKREREKEKKRVLKGRE
jgi:hypothetical protein